MSPQEKYLIGFIGQGWIGKHYANDFEQRGFRTVRYSMEHPYNGNKEKIQDCDIVFIAVPTPTTPEGFDDSIVRNVISLVGTGKIAVIKSTILPGTTESIQQQYPDITVVHSPEFLREVHAAHDASHPNRNIIGVPVLNDTYRSKAREVLGVLPAAPYELVCQSRVAEMVKYVGNCFLYTKVIFANLVYELSQEIGCDYDAVREAVGADPRIGDSHLQVVHQEGRGAGGHCFIKDFAAFREMFEKYTKDTRGLRILSSMEEKNKELLQQSGKDLDLLEGVYGEN